MAAIEMTRIDLRSRVLGAAQLRAALPAAAWMWRRVPVVRPVVEAVAQREPRRPGTRRVLRRSAARQVRDPVARLDEALVALAPNVRSASRWRSGARERCTPIAAHRHRDDARPRATVTERSMPGRGWVCTCRAATPSTSSVVDERRCHPDGRRRSPVMIGSPPRSHASPTCRVRRSWPPPASWVLSMKISAVSNAEGMALLAVSAAPDAGAAGSGAGRHRRRSRPTSTSPRPHGSAARRSGSTLKQARRKSPILADHAADPARPLTTNLIGPGPQGRRRDRPPASGDAEHEARRHDIRGLADQLEDSPSPRASDSRRADKQKRSSGSCSSTTTSILV